jgi:hypothetical protein
MIEDPDQHEEAYHNDLQSWEEEHAPLQQTNRLYKDLLPHYNDATGKYVNEIRPNPTAYVHERSSTPQEQVGYSIRPYTHPAQQMWENGELAELPNPANPL